MPTIHSTTVNISITYSEHLNLNKDVNDRPILSRVKTVKEFEIIRASTYLQESPVPFLLSPRTPCCALNRGGTFRLVCLDKRAASRLPARLPPPGNASRIWRDSRQPLTQALFPSPS